MTAGEGQHNPLHSSAQGVERDAHGYPAGVLPTRMPVTPTQAAHASAKARGIAGQPGRTRYPASIRALISREAQTPLADPAHDASKWHELPGDHEIDFLPVAPHQTTANTATPTYAATDGFHAGKAAAGFWNSLFAAPLFVIKLPCSLARAVFSGDDGPGTGDYLPSDAPASYPQPGGGSADLVTPSVRYDPEANDQAARLLERHRALNTAPSTPAHATTPESILPPASVEPASRTSAGPSHWHEPGDDSSEPVNAPGQHPAHPEVSDTPAALPETPAPNAEPKPNPIVTLARGIRRCLVTTFSIIFTVARWTPRVLWCCSFGLLKAFADILSEAAQTSKAPAPLKQREAADAEPETESRAPLADHPPKAMPLPVSAQPIVSHKAVRVYPAQRPAPAAVLPEHKPATATPRPQVSAIDDAHAHAPALDAPPEVEADPLAPPPVPPLYPVTRDAIDEIAAAKRCKPIAAAPSSTLLVFEADIPADVPHAAQMSPGFFSSGLGNLLLILMGSTILFSAGFALSLVDHNTTMMAGVLLMIAGVGGSLLSMMLLNEWVNALRFQMVLPVRLGVRVMGLCAAISLLMAFAAVTIPREHWPI
ncbi:MAG: hypothetical protein AAGA29_02275 [Planctomycetota bacterium]